MTAMELGFRVRLRREEEKKEKIEFEAIVCLAEAFNLRGFN